MLKIDIFDAVIISLAFLFVNKSTLFIFCISYFVYACKRRV